LTKRLFDLCAAGLGLLLLSPLLLGMWLGTTDPSSLDLRDEA
jgi:lipopolysaccharide/colanic/teichoic acid biosynthesis glycosyltransferase